MKLTTFMALCVIACENDAFFVLGNNLNRITPFIKHGVSSIHVGNIISLVRIKG